MLPAIDDFTELSAPIADVVVRDHLMAENTRDSGETISKNRAANVADVHWLGNIRRAEVDDDPLPVLRNADAQPVVPEHRHHPASKESCRQPEVDKPGARHFRRFAKILDIQIAENLLGKALRCGPEFLCQDHRHVALIIAKPRIGGGNHLGHHPGVGFNQSQFEPFGKEFARSRH